ncbi:hypothetical protein [Candidatus Puniceispirillum sp.]|uniref:hypothetical protein n=1 Tax=Candidatus Puniceispirillum sp. TaxID=2026719 RepID=UPI003F6A2F3C
MSEDVVDIRKRIEEIRNEVSSASVSQREEPRSRSVGNIAELAVAQAAQPQYETPISQEVTSQAPQEVPQNDTKSALDSALQMPAFTLNVKNQVSNKTLLAFCVIQTLSNIAVIGVLMWKLG